MANSKISALTTLAEGDIAPTLDFIPIADASASETKKVTPDTIVASALAQTTANTINGSTIISVSSASDALRITQDGAGNALVVEDSTNPDSSPFVIDASGNVFVGQTTSIIGPNAFARGVQFSNKSGLQLGLYSNSASGDNLTFTKSRGSVTAPHTIVQSGDVIGTISFSGSDGTNFITAAQIIGIVDGTPGANDMPGRIIFSTTADGASSTTERMRIDSAGNIGFGGATSLGRSILSSKALTGAVGATGFDNAGIVQSDVTSAANYFRSIASTVAAVFTLSDLRHFHATQSTIGAGSSVTNQYSFIAESNLIGAANNFGFYGNIPAGTGRWNFYANGTARNYFAGGVEPLAGTTTQAVGFINISAAAGVPTGVPTNPTGNVPLYYDTTNNKLYVYNAGWKSTAALT